jgi:hypothetical protein
MFWKVVNSVGGRGFVFAIMAFWITSGYAQWGSMEWSEWVDYNKWIGGLMLGAKAVEGAATKLRGKRD